jgi:SET domain-containing protein
MLMVRPVDMKPSEIHGTGIFAKAHIRKNRVIWQFESAVDRAIPPLAVKHADPYIAEFIRERGYLSTQKPQWILCCDEAAFWNFPRKGEEANTKLGDVLNGEHLILAARDIEAGEELTIPPESDADYDRKMQQR